jgi:hypothetical protein
MKAVFAAAAMVGAVLVVSLIVWRHLEVDNAQTRLNLRARNALHLGAPHTQTILVCMVNRQKNGYSIGNFVDHALNMATSPLRVVFAVVSDATATIPAQEEIRRTTQHVDFRIDVRTATTSQTGFLASLKLFRDLHQQEGTVMVVDTQQTELVTGWDTILMNFMSAMRPWSQNRKVVFSAESPSSFPALSPGHDTCSWPTLQSRPFVAVPPRTAVPSLLAVPSMMVFPGKSFELLVPPTRPVAVPRMCGALFLTDILVRQQFWLFCLQAGFFRSRFVDARDTVDCDVVWKQLEKADDLSKKTREHVGLDSEMACQPRALCGLTSNFMHGEAQAKYGSVTLARAAVAKVVSEASRRTALSELPTGMGGVF